MAGTGFDFADFLLGLPQSSSLRFGSDDNYFRGWATSVYAQDDYRISRGLSINFGLRYEYFAPYTELRGNMANLVLAPGFTSAEVVTPATASQFGLPSSLVKPDRTPFSPRFGVAWRPSAKQQYRGARRIQHFLQWLAVCVDRFADGFAAAVRENGVDQHQSRRSADA